ncbi:hypothetical protein MTO96_002207 [Rhipicephalus appendiculatus]
MSHVAVTLRALVGIPAVRPLKNGWRPRSRAGSAPSPGSSLRRSRTSVAPAATGLATDNEEPEVFSLQVLRSMFLLAVHGDLRARTFAA